MTTETTGVIEEIAAERKRQISNEGWTPEHDDLHSNGQLALAASCYASQSSLLQDALCYDQTQTPKLWPWQPKWWKPKNPRRDLIRAAALIIAEIERLDRCQKKQ